MKKIFTLLLLLPLAGIAQPALVSHNTFRVQPPVAQTDSIAPDSTDMRVSRSAEIAAGMFPGLNIGNTLEATPGETSWGNPMITQQLIDSIKAAGFNSIRIPVSWSKFVDTSTYEINSAWLDRVEEVVNYVLSDGMYAMINEHYDGGWMQPTPESRDYVNRRLAAMWEQIAVRFRDYDDHLIFAGMNEITSNGSTTALNYAAHNSFVQTFVSTIRATGGRNTYRYLAVQGFNTNIDQTCNFFVIPADPTPRSLLVEVHYYDPYNFTINNSDPVQYEWGMYAQPGKAETWANEAWADGQFQKMKTKFIDNGYPVILGEYSATARTNFANAADYAKYRLYYHGYITRSMARHGLVPMYWDAGGSGNHCSNLFYRATGAQAYPDHIRSIVDTVVIPPVATGIATTDASPSKYSLTQNYPNPFNPETTISFTIPSRSFVTLKIIDSMGREVATLVSKELPAGSYSEKWDASTVSSGVYFYRFQAGLNFETKKLVLVR